jgi:hypothetical protein
VFAESPTTAHVVVPVSSSRIVSSSVTHSMVRAEPASAPSLMLST